MKKRNLMLLTAIAAASVLMAGCGFAPDDSADSQAVTISPEPADPTATPAPTSTPTPTAAPTSTPTPTPTADGTSADGASADGISGTAADGTSSTDSTAAGSADVSSSSSSSASTSSGDAASYVGSTLNQFMNVYGTPIEYEPAYDANGNEIGGVYSFDSFSITTNFIDYSYETVEAVDYY